MLYNQTNIVCHNLTLDFLVRLEQVREQKNFPNGALMMMNQTHAVTMTHQIQDIKTLHPDLPKNCNQLDTKRSLFVQALDGATRGIY